MNTEDSHLPPKIVIMTATVVTVPCYIYKGAWWYNSCHYSNLNGLYLHGEVNGQGMSWYHWKNNYYSVKRSDMKIRPRDF